MILTDTGTWWELFTNDNARITENVTWQLETLVNTFKFGVIL